MELTDPISLQVAVKLFSNWLGQVRLTVVQSPCTDS